MAYRIYPQLIFHQNPHEYVIYANDGEKYKYELKDLVLHVQKVQPSERTLHYNNERIRREPALYPFYACKGNEFICAANQTRVTTTPLFGNKVPTMVIYYFQTLNQAQGSHDTVPTIFYHHNIKSFTQKISGISSPCDTLEWDWTANHEDYNVAYRSLVDHCGLSTLNKSNCIDFDSYKLHRFFIVISNSPNGIGNIGDMSRERVQDGTELTVQIEWHRRNNQPLVLKTIGIFDSLYGINDARELIFESSTAL